MLHELMRWVYDRLQSDKGATMVEYGLLIVLIALVAAAGAILLGQGLDALFTKIANCITGAGVCI